MKKKTKKMKKLRKKNIKLRKMKWLKKCSLKDRLDKQLNLVRRHQLPKRSNKYNRKSFKLLIRKMILKRAMNPKFNDRNMS
jgi:hypothetical protein